MRWFRWFRKALAVLLAVVAIGGLALYWYSDALMRAGATPAFAALPRGDAAAGERLAAIEGCSNCHRADLGGKPFISIPKVVALVAPDLTRARLKYDDAGLLRVLRAGVKADGYYALGMPHYMQQRLTDREAADIIAYVRSVPAAAGGETKVSRVLPLGRIGVVVGKYRPYEGDAPESAGVLRDRAEQRLGRHLALIACTECHGKRFEGNANIGAPPLAIAKAYSLEQFRALMGRGITLAGTKSRTGLMSEVSEARLSRLRPEEVEALHAWLNAPDGLR